MIFKSLSSALEEYKKKQPEEITLPDKEELDKIRSEEERGNWYIELSKMRHALSPGMIAFQNTDTRLRDIFSKQEFATNSNIQNLLDRSRLFSSPQHYEPNAVKDNINKGEANDQDEKKSMNNEADNDSKR